MHKWLSNILQNFYAKRILALLSIAGGYAAITTSDFGFNHRHVTFCAFKQLTGLPCPGCGMGRATLSLLKGDFVSSWHYNILCIPFNLVVVVLFMGIIADLIYIRDIYFHKVRMDIKPIYKYSVYSILLIDWVVNIVRHV